MLEIYLLGEKIRKILIKMFVSTWKRKEEQLNSIIFLPTLSNDEVMFFRFFNEVIPFNH